MESLSGKSNIWAPQKQFLSFVFLSLCMGHTSYFFTSHNFLLKTGHLRSYIVATLETVIPYLPHPQARIFCYWYLIFCYLVIWVDEFGEVCFSCSVKPLMCTQISLPPGMATVLAGFSLTVFSPISLLTFGSSTSTGITLNC